LAPARPHRRVVDLLEAVLADVADRDPRLAGAVTVSKEKRNGLRRP
jgi:hypothetical protein